MTSLSAEDLKSRRNWQAIITVIVLLVVGFLVILPLVFLVEESLNTGDPMAFPPESYGLKNFIAIFDEDIHVLWNTLIIAVMATVMAILIGFTLAWILTRTNVPGREKLEREIEPFRVIGNPFMRAYVNNGWAGKLFLEGIYALQQIAPSYSGRYGQMPAIILRKDDGAREAG